MMVTLIDSGVVDGKPSPMEWSVEPMEWLSSSFACAAVTRRQRNDDIHDIAMNHSIGLLLVILLGAACYKYTGPPAP